MRGGLGATCSNGQFRVSTQLASSFHRIPPAPQGLQHRLWIATDRSRLRPAQLDLQGGSRQTLLGSPCQHPIHTHPASASTHRHACSAAHRAAPVRRRGCDGPGGAGMLVNADSGHHCLICKRLAPQSPLPMPPRAITAAAARRLRRPPLVPSPPPFCHATLQPTAAVRCLAGGAARQAGRGAGQAGGRRGEQHLVLAAGGRPEGQAVAGGWVGGGGCTCAMV